MMKKWWTLYVLYLILASLTSLASYSQLSQELQEPARAGLIAIGILALIIGASSNLRASLWGALFAFLFCSLSLTAAILIKDSPRDKLLDALLLPLLWTMDYLSLVFLMHLIRQHLAAKAVHAS